MFLEIPSPPVKFQRLPEGEKCHRCRGGGTNGTGDSHCDDFGFLSMTMYSRSLDLQNRYGPEETHTYKKRLPHNIRGN